MKLLAIEGSTAWLSVCAYDARDGRAIAIERERSGANASARILEFVQRTLEQAGWTLDDLDGVAFGSGPGAFTGLRVVCGVVQGLALGSGLPVAGVPSFVAVAQAAWRAHGVTRVVACLDARMHEVYVAACRRRDGDWMVEAEPAVARPDDVALHGVASPGGFGAGDGFAVAPSLATRLGLTGVDATIVPDAVDVAALAAPAFAAGRGRPAGDAQPLYVRHRVALTEAERAAGARM